MAIVVPPPTELTQGRQGHYAGSVSRLVAFAVDIALIWGLFVVGTGGVSLAIQLVTGHGITLSHHRVIWLIFVVGWGFIYFAYQWALSGKTIGMAIFGLQVVAAEGNPAGGRQAVFRTMALPLSFLLLGLGLVGILVQKERRALHDMIAGTAVIYSWDARAARLRWLARKELDGRPAGPALPEDATASEG